ncbi:MAG: 30S ribosomal protein S20 [Candidatus Paceibacterota bacterium]
MPIIKSAKKALRGSKRKRLFNLRKKEQVSKTIKQVKKLLVEKDVKGAEALMSKVQKVLDKSAKTGLLKKNTVARKKSRISAMIKKAK